MITILIQNYNHNPDDNYFTFFQVAYGTFSFINEDGIEKIMPAIIRTINAARIVELLICDLKQAKEAGEITMIPAESTLFRILSYCPAKQQQALKAINPYHVSCTKLFKIM